jgi:hypothetical protein
VEKCALKLIPYFAWCHRGAGEMQTWFPVVPRIECASADFRLSASHCFPKDSVAAACDGILPTASDDGSVPRHTFWDHLGTAEWVVCEFNAPETLKGVSLYWFDDGKKGNCRLPESWKVQWRAAKDAPWQNVAAPGPVAKDRFCSVDFPAPVKAQAVRIDIQLRKGWSGGILEWQFR